MKKWECTVCGYIHEGDEPPNECPVCGVGPEYFKEVTAAEPETETGAALQSDEAAAPAQESAAGPPSGIVGLVLHHHLHPISVHTPNGVLPLALVFLALAMFFGFAGLETASFYNMVFVLLSLPVVIITGFIEWRNRYKGVMTKVFVVKIAASVVVSATLLAMVVWRVVDPGVSFSPGRWIYLLVALVMVGAVGLAGHLGGTLVHAGRNT